MKDELINFATAFNINIKMTSSEALVRLGKTLYLRFGNFLRRVLVEKVRQDVHGEIIAEESYIDPDDENDRFAAEETPVEELAKDLDLAEENSDLKKQVKNLLAKK